MTKWLIPLLATAFIATGCGGSDPALAPDVKTQLDAELGAIVSDAARPLASLSVVAFRNGEFVYEGQFGQRSVEQNLLSDADTIYRIASISKMVMAVGFMKLVESGAIDLDADVGTYLGFGVRNPAFPTQVITSRMLLSHTASLRDVSDLIFTQVGQSLASKLAATDPVSRKALFWIDDAAQAPNKAYFTYANYNFIVLATIMERVSKQRFDLYMKAAVLDPLGAKGGYYPYANIAATDYANLATLYRKSADGGDTWNPAGAWFPQGIDRTGVAPTPIANIDSYVVGSNAGVFGPQGNLRLTARGLAAVMQMLMNKGSFNGVAILKPETATLMMAPQWSYNDSASEPNGDTYYDLFYKWGLGMQVFTDRGGSEASGDRVGSAAAGGFTGGVGHLGEAYGLLSGFVFDPVTRNGMIYLIDGLGADPNDNLGAYSAFFSWEESILRALYQRAILQSLN